MQFEIGQIVEASFGWSAESNFGRYLVLKLGSFADQAYFQVLRWMTAKDLFPDLY